MCFSYGYDDDGDDDDIRKGIPAWRADVLRYYTFTYTHTKIYATYDYMPALSIAVFVAIVTF
jgi:hypothetical protein